MCCCEFLKEFCINFMKKEYWKKLANNIVCIVCNLIKVLPIFAIIFFIWFSYPSWMKPTFSYIPDLVLEISPTATVKTQEEKQEKKSFGDLFGTFGDSFGALNTLFSGFAFAGIIISIVLQSKELKATRDEVEAQRKEFEKQTAVFNKQTFENTFFQMLQQHNELIKSITTKDDKNNTIHGREALKHYFFLLEGIITTIKEKRIDVKTEIESMYEEYLKSGHTKDQIASIIVNYYTKNSTLKDYKNPIDIYTTFHNRYAPQLRIYFMSIYQLLKYVKDKEKCKEITNGKFYTNILRAQLLDDELLLLFFNCLSEKLGANEFKPVVESYAFFEHIPSDCIDNDFITRIIEHNKISLYSDQAFGSNEELINKISAVKRNIKNYS